MTGEWRQSSWGAIATLEYGKGLRDYRVEEGLYRVFGTNGPIGWHDRPLCTHAGVIVGRKGAYRGIHYSPEPFFVIDTAFYLEQKEPIDMRWAYYCLLTYDINGMDSGSAIPSTSREAFYRLPVTVPPLKEQQAIACILGALDDKIEVNRRMNGTLEAMARALFQDWFVDFGPVRAKAAGQAPAGLSEAVAALFPARLVEVEGRVVPEGWEVKGLPHLVEVNPRRLLPKGTVAPYLDMANMPTQGPSPESWGHREVGSGAKFTNGDTLVARITPCLENGKTAYVDFLPDDVVGWGSTEYIVLRPKGKIPSIYAYLLARTDEFRTFAIHQMTGSSGRQRVPANSLVSYFVPSPDVDSPIFLQFGQLVAPLFDRIGVAMAESRKLAALRDALLPKLIAGEVRVADAERVVGRCL